MGEYGSSVRRESTEVLLSLLMYSPGAYLRVVHVQEMKLRSKFYTSLLLIEVQEEKLKH